MNEITKLIESLKDISKTNLLVIVFSVAIILLVYNFNTYAPHIESMIKTIHEQKKQEIVRDREADIVNFDDDNFIAKPPEISTYGSEGIEESIITKNTNNRFVVSLEDMDITEYNLEIIKQYSDEIFKDTSVLLHDLPVLMTIYKFIPEGNDIYFQGRLLVTDNNGSDLDLDIILKEAGLVWVPMWVNKGTLERIMNDETFLSELYREENKRGVFLENDLNTRGRVDMTLIYDNGVKYFLFYPITKYDYPIGYISWGLKYKPDEKELNILKTKSASLSSRIYNYMLNEK